MFKKSLAVVAVLGAFAGASFAANVSLYGAMDPGFQYSYVKAKHVDKQDSFKMVDGAGQAGLVGVKGEEQIADNLAVGFKLENGFDIKNGDFKTEGKLFDREAVMYVKSAAGTFAFGREGALASGFGMFGKFGGAVSAVSNGYGDAPGLKFVMGDSFKRYDNSITYQSPNFAGVNLLAQYANAEQNNDGYFDKDENSRYGALGATFQNDVAYGALILSQEQVFVPKKGTVDAHHAKKSTKVSLGGRYNVDDNLKVFAATQIFNKSNLAVDIIYNQAFNNDAALVEKNKKTKLAAQANNGFGINLGASYKMGKSVFMGNFGYMHAKEVDLRDGAAAKDFGKVKTNRFTVMGAYDYNLSNRSKVYAYAGGYFDNYKNLAVDYAADKKDIKEVKNGRALFAGFGLAHKF